MNLIKNENSKTEIERYLGKPYSLGEQLKLLGTGSSKIIYAKGISALDEVNLQSNSLLYTSFELYTQGLLLRTTISNQTKCIAIKNESIVSINFISRKIRVLYKWRTLIRFIATIEFQLQDGKKIEFIVPQSFYKPIKKYFSKDWLKSVVNFKESELEPIKDFKPWVVRMLMRSITSDI